MQCANRRTRQEGICRQIFLSRFAALVAADPHGFDVCPNSVLPAGFDTQSFDDTSNPSVFAPVVDADAPGFSCCPDSARPAVSDRQRTIDTSCQSRSTLWSLQFLMD